MTDSVACYVRVSTENQSLERQLQATHDYVESEFGKPPDRTFRDKSTGTNTERSGYQDMMEAVESGEIGVVVANSMSRVARSNQDLQRIHERFRDAGAELHFVVQPVTLGDLDGPQEKLIADIFAALAEWEASITQQRVREGISARQSEEDYHHGPPPLGFTKDDGRLYEKTDGIQSYPRVCTVLEDVAAGEQTKYGAAQELNCSRKTIQNAIEKRPELYGLE